MEGDTLLDSDSGSFDSLTFLPAGSNLEERPSKKRSFDNLNNTISTSSTLPATSSSLKRASAQKEKKKRKVSFMISDDEGKKEGAGMAKPNHYDGDRKLSKEEIEEMKRKTEHWWSLPDGTTQEEFDHAFDHFKDGRYFQTHMEMEWMDVKIQRACARLLAQDQFSNPVQQLCVAIHAAITHNDDERAAKLVQEDPELTQLIEQYKATQVDMLAERQRLTDKFGMIHSAKIAIKSEVYVCSATRLKQSGKEVTDEAVEEELAAFERGVNTVPGSQPQGGCIMAQGYRGPPIDASAGMGTCPVRHAGQQQQQQSPPRSPQTAAAQPPPAGVCPFTGRRAPTSGAEPSQQQPRRVEESVSALPAPTEARGVCPYTGHKAPTCGDEGVQPPEEDDGVGG